MSESESESSAKEIADTEKPMFPIENKFYSEKDKAHIISLSEIERESILAERAQLLERKRQDQQLRRLLQARENTESRNSEKKKRNATTADLEDSQRKSSRQKTTLGGRKVGETSSAMKEYKRQLEQKGIRDEERRRQGEDRRDRKGRASVDDGYSDADADGESEVEWDDGKPKASEHGVRKDEPAELIDVERVRIGRDNFGKVCFYPGFDDAIKNCFARVSIGDDKATGENIYRVAQIKGTQSLWQKAPPLKSNRVHRGKAVRNGRCQRETFYHEAVRSGRCGQVPKRLAIPCLLKLEIYRGLLFQFLEELYSNYSRLSSSDIKRRWLVRS